MVEFSINCQYCDGPETLLRSSLPKHVSDEAWRKAWKTRAPDYQAITCSACGARYQLEDDGVPVSTGGFVRSKNVSSPRLDSLTIGSGVRGGGEALLIRGSALDVGNLIVKFAGKQVQTVTNRSATQARVVTPVGCYTFPNPSLLYKITLSSATGTFGKDQVVSFTGGAQGTIRQSVTPKIFWVEITPFNGDLAGLAGKTMTGPNGSGSVAAISPGNFLIGESLRGTTSEARGVVRSLTPFIVDTPTDAFSIFELVVGDASGAHLRLSAVPFSGDVDVTVENEYGHRLTGGTLVGGFTYL